MKLETPLKNSGNIARVNGKGIFVERWKILRKIVTFAGNYINYKRKIIMFATVKKKAFGSSVLPDNAISTEIAKKLMAFSRITTNLRKMEEENPLPSEFDEILSHRLHFNTSAVI